MRDGAPPEVEDPTPIADVWADSGCVSLVIRNASIIEYEGELTPGVALTPVGAMKLAEALLENARRVMEEQAEEG